jgi:hypothetical protein
MQNWIEKIISSGLGLIIASIYLKLQYRRDILRNYFLFNQAPKNLSYTL